jgi:hypothetical protein
LGSFGGIGFVWRGGGAECGFLERKRGVVASFGNTMYGAGVGLICAGVSERRMGSFCGKRLEGLIYAGLCRFWKVRARGCAGVREGCGGLVMSGHSASYRKGRRCAGRHQEAHRGREKCVFEQGMGKNFLFLLVEGGARLMPEGAARTGENFAELRREGVCVRGVYRWRFE